MRNFFFGFLGLCSAITLAMLALLILPGAIKGDFSVITLFFEEHPGSEPFVIFVMPVVLIAGTAWIIRSYSDWRKQKEC